MVIDDQMKYQSLADKSLDGQLLSREECYGVLNCSPRRLTQLLESAFRVREKYFGRKVTIQMLINAKSGMCTEDCAYCSQSATSRSSVEKFLLKDDDAIVKRALHAKESSAKRYCIVTSGRSVSNSELEQICRVVKRIKKEAGIEVCTSLGFLSEEAAICLKGAGVDRYNHNLNTSERFYPSICTTHTYADRVETLRHARNAGLKVCCGALFGMGETDDDIIDLAVALREQKVSSIPVNFLHPIENTSLANVKYLNPPKCLAILSLIRFINPDTEIRVAGGWEYNLQKLQSLAFFPANSIFVSGYLTTGGITPQEARKMVTEMGFEVDQETVGKIGAVL